MYSGYKSFIRSIICNYFLLVCGLAYHHFLNSILNSMKFNLSIYFMGYTFSFLFFFGQLAYGILVPQPGIKTPAPCTGKAES